MDIKKVFKRYGLTSKDVAKEMKTNASNLSMIIKKGNPSYNNLCEIAKAVGCTVSELVADEEENRATKVVCPKCGKEIIVKVE